jgi:DNA-binding GntR family transcriptional regulator
MSVPLITALPRLDRTHTGGDLADRVRGIIEDAILRGQFTPGARLNADAIAKQLGTSHIPLREAFRALASEGWIEFRPYQGAFVTMRTEQELIDLFEMRLCVEPRSALLGAERRSNEHIATLEAILARQRSTTDPVEFAELNARFHTAVAQCSQNQHMARCITALNTRVRFYFTPAVTVRHDKSLAEHGAILQAIRQRQAQAAEQLTFDHIDGTQCELQQSLTWDAPPEIL